MKHLNEYVMQMIEFDNKTYGYEQRQELVRCKDCKHGINGTYDLKENRVIYIDCDKAETHEPDWFCADGERKE